MARFKGDLGMHFSSKWKGAVATISRNNSGDSIYGSEESKLIGLEEGWIIIENFTGEVDRVDVYLNRSGMLILDVRHSSVKYIEASVQEFENDWLEVEIASGEEFEESLYCSVLLPVKSEDLVVSAYTWPEKYRTKIILLEEDDFER